MTGEESAEQTALRAQRLQVDTADVKLLAEIQLERIAATLEAERPEIAVIDSIQTLYSDALTSAPGSVAQVRECAAQLTRVAKGHGIALVFIGHVTKEGVLAGPRVLEHIVDTVLYFEGDSNSSFRLIRAFKNRFGPVNELGVFAMTEKGLRGVSNPSALFLSQHREPVPGSCILVTNEGTRPLLVEVQALVDGAQGMNPRRLAQGLDQSRLAMLLAVLHRHAGVACHDQDVFVNAVGGVRIGEPAADLAVLLAIVSSVRGRPLPEKLVVFGEVGLAGEVRPAPRGQERLREAARLGFRARADPAGECAEAAGRRDRGDGDRAARRRSGRRSVTDRPVRGSHAAAHRGLERRGVIACGVIAGEQHLLYGCRDRRAREPRAAAERRAPLGDHPGPARRGEVRQAGRKLAVDGGGEVRVIERLMAARCAQHAGDEPALAREGAAVEGPLQQPVREPEHRERQRHRFGVLQVDGVDRLVLESLDRLCDAAEPRIGSQQRGGVLRSARDDRPRERRGVRIEPDGVGAGVQRPDRRPQADLAAAARNESGRRLRKERAEVGAGEQQIARRTRRRRACRAARSRTLAQRRDPRACSARTRTAVPRAVAATPRSDAGR